MGETIEPCELSIVRDPSRVTGYYRFPSDYRIGFSFVTLTLFFVDRQDKISWNNF